jgi:hypothetical protein
MCQDINAIVNAHIQYCHVTYTNATAKGMTWAFNNRLKQMTKSETFEPNSLGKISINSMPIKGVLTITTLQA